MSLFKISKKHLVFFVLGSLVLNLITPIIPVFATENLSPQSFNEEQFIDLSEELFLYVQTNLSKKYGIKIIGIDFNGNIMNLNFDKKTRIVNEKDPDLFHQAFRQINELIVEFLLEKKLEQYNSFEYNFLIEGQNLYEKKKQTMMSSSLFSKDFKKVILNPGHGYRETQSENSWEYARPIYNDPGNNLGYDINEDNLNAELAIELNQALKNAGFETIPVREMDKNAGIDSESGYPWWQMGAREYTKYKGAPPNVWDTGDLIKDKDVNARPFYGNYTNGDIMISIHNNGNYQKTPGTETWYDATNSYSEESKKLATLVHNKIISKLRAEWDDPNWGNRGAKAAYEKNYGENYKFNGPAALVELAFLDDPIERTAVKNPKFRSIAMEAIKEAIIEYRGSPPLQIPKLINPPDGKELVSKVDFFWENIPQAQAYEIYIQLNYSGSAGGFDPMSFEVKNSNYSLPIWSYKDILGTWKVRAKYAGEVYGNWSEERSFLAEGYADYLYSIGGAENNIGKVMIDGMYIDPKTNELQFIYKAELPEGNQPKVNLTSEINKIKKLFLQSLTVPNNKQWISLDPNPEYCKGGELKQIPNSPEPFRQTDLARIMFIADVNLKEFWDANFRIGSYEHWKQLVKSNPIWPSLSAKGFNNDIFCPSRAAIIHGKVEANSTDKAIAITDAGIGIESENYKVCYLHNWFTPLSNFSSQELNVLNGLLNKQSDWWTQYQIERQSWMMDQINTQDTYADLRQTYQIISLAQWYKTLPRQNLPYADLIDSEKLNGLVDNPITDEEIKNLEKSLAFYFDINDFYGQSQSLFVNGGAVFTNTKVDVTGELTEDQQTLMNNILENQSYVKEGDSYYVYGGSLNVEKTELIPSMISMDPLKFTQDEPVKIEAIINNSANVDSGAFNIIFYDQYKDDKGNTVKTKIGEKQIGELLAWQETKAEITFTPWLVGEHEFIVTVDELNHVIELNKGNNLISKTVNVLSKYPETYITSPISGSSFGNTKIFLSGYALNAKTGYLSGEKMEWKSSLDGILGTGSILEIPQLTVGEHLITLKATNDAGNSTEDKIIFYVSPAGSPAVSILSPVNNQTLSSDIKLDFLGTANDANDGDLCDLVSYESDIDGVLGESCHLQSSLSVGTHHLSLVAENSAGKKSAAQITVNIVEGKPTLNILNPADNSTFAENQEIQFTATASDPQNGNLSSLIQWNSNKDGYFGKGNILNKKLSAGSHIITANVVDNDGLIAEKKINLKINFIAPTVNIISPTPAQTFKYGESINLQGNATDYPDTNIPDGKFIWESSLQGYLGIGANINVNNLVYGTHDIKLTVTDSDSQIGIAEAKGIFVDAGQPDALIISPQNNTSFPYGASIAFNGQALDIKDGRISNNNLVWTSSLNGELGTGENITTANLKAGTHTIRLTAVDSDGLVDYFDIKIIINPPHNPEISFVSPLNNSEYLNGSNVLLKAIVTDFEDGNLPDNKITWVSNINGILGNGKELTVNNLSVGLHTITIKAVDILGAETSTDVKINLKQRPPIAVISSPSENTVFAEQENITFSGSGTDFEDGNISDNNLIWRSNLNGELGKGKNISINNLKIGTHIITLTAIDNNGDVGNANIKIIIQGFGSVLLDKFSNGEKNIFNSFSDGGGNITVTIDIPKNKEIINAQLKIKGNYGDPKWEQQLSGQINGKIHDIYLSGLTVSSPVFVDIDADNDKDLFIGNITGQIRFYQNTGTSQNPIWKWMTDLYGGVKGGGYPIFIDIDADNDFDLFVGRKDDGRIKFYRNDGTPQNAIWTLVTDYYANIDVGGTFAIPTFADIDTDDDYDLFVGGGDTGHLRYYQNIGTAQNPIWSLIFYDYPANVGHNLYSTFADIDSDGDLDLFQGGGNINFIKNNGTPTVPNWEYITSNYANINVGEMTVPVFTDIDFDSDLDLFIGEYNGNINYYRNDGTVQNPNWTLVNTEFPNFDSGEVSSPAFADIDSDSDLDFFIGDWGGGLNFYRNDGNFTTANWSFVTEQYTGGNLGYTLHDPVFADIDADLDLDLFFGSYQGKIIFYRNDGNNQNPIWTLVNENYANIIVSNNSVPAFIDIDADSDLDLFVGEKTFGKLNYYRNDGTAQNPIWTLVSNAYLGIDGSYGSSPVFIDIDGDNDQDLFLGNDGGSITFYRNKETISNPNWELITNNYAGINTSSFSHPVFADIDKDQDPDLFIGEGNGGILFFKNNAPFPTNPALDAANNGTTEWSYSGEFKGEETTANFSAEINSYLENYTGEEEIVSVPLSVHSDSGGVLQFSNLNIQYLDVDKEKPIINNVSIDINPVTAGNNFKITVNATDNAGIASVKANFAGADYVLNSMGENNYEASIKAQNAGIYDLKILVTDINGLQAEQSVQLKVTAAGPDLFVPADKISAPSTINEGDNIQISADVNNIGDTAANNVEVTLYIDNNPSSTKTISIGSAIQQSISFDWTTIVGDHFVKVKADPNNKITEINELNNEALLNIKVIDKTAPIIEDINLVSSTVIQNKTFTVEVAVTDNLEMQDVKADWLGQTIIFTYDSNKKLYAKTLTASEIGDKKLTIIAQDKAGLISTKAINVQVISVLPDLAVSEFDIAFDGVNKITLTVNNNGGSNVSSAKADFYLDNNYKESKTVSVSALSKTSVDFIFTVTSSNHEVKFVVDPNKLITESNENNNEAKLKLNTELGLPPEIGAVSVASEAIQNQTFAVTVAIIDNKNLQSVKANWLNQDYTFTYDSANNLYKGTLNATTLGINNLIISAFNTAGISSKKILEIKVLADLPDLKINNIENIQSPMEAAASHLITAGVSNAGSKDASNIKIVLAAKGVESGSQIIDLAKGETKNVSFDWLAGKEPGLASLKIQIDPANIIPEQDEENNFLETQTMIADSTPPLINNIIIPGIIYSGQSVDLAVEATDNVLISSVLAKLNGTTYTFIYNSGDQLYHKTINVGTSGTKNLTIEAYDSSSLSAKITRQIIVEEILADLSVSPVDLTISTLPMIEGKKANIAIDVYNKGGTDANNASLRILVDNSAIYNTTLNILKAGKASANTEWMPVYGNHELKIEVDYNNAISESDETNNNIIKTIYAADLTSPIIPIAQINPFGWTLKNQFVISWQASSDLHGIKQYQYRIDQGEWISIELNRQANITVDQDGIHPVLVRAEDNNGNFSDPGIVFAQIDKTVPHAPLISESHSGPTWTNHDTPYFSWKNPGDEGSGVDHYLVQTDGNPSVNIGNGLDYHPTLTTGVHSIKIKAVDLVENESVWSNEINVSIDLELPEKPIINSETHQNPNLWYANNIPKFAWTTPADLSVIKGYYYLLNHVSDTELNQSGYWTTANNLEIKTMPFSENPNDEAIPVQDGEWYFHVAAQDSVGNFGKTAHLKLKIDTSAPFTSDNYSETHSVPFDIKLTAVDPFSGVKSTFYRIDNGTWQTGTTVTIGDNKNHLVEYYSIDNLGNTETIKSFNVQEKREEGIYLPFDEPVGATIFSDLSGNKNNAVCESGKCPLAGKSGKLNFAVEFDGKKSAAQVGDSETIRPKKEITISAWIKPANGSSSILQTIITKQQDYEITIDKTGTLNASITNESKKRVILTVVKAIKINEWNLVTMTYDGATIKAYVNGELKGSKQQRGYILQSSVGRTNKKYPLSIGNFSGKYYFYGLLDELKIFARALKNDEIKNLFQGGN